MSVCTKYSRSYSFCVRTHKIQVKMKIMIHILHLLHVTTLRAMNGLLVFIFFLAVFSPMSAIFIRIPSGDLAPIIYLEEGASLDFTATSMDSSTFRVYFSTPKDWNNCVSSDYQKCMVLLKYEYTGLRRFSEHFGTFNEDVVLIMRSENLLEDIEIDYTVSYTSSEFNLTMGFFTLLIIGVCISLPCIAMWCIVCIGSCVISYFVVFLRNRTTVVHSQYNEGGYSQLDY